ncbi:MAG: cytochrome c peroxidase [Pseudomonadota bacterium]
MIPAASTHAPSTGAPRLTGLALLCATLVAGCGGGGGGDTATTTGASGLDATLRQLATTHGASTDPTAGRTLPAITDPLAQLGRDLFFSQSLGGGFDSACVSCHHPVLGGADALALSVGVGATTPHLLGPGRQDADGVPDVPRNAPTVFNLGLWDTGLFWDSRVESLGRTPGQNGAGSGIRTPETLIGTADPNAGGNLATAQARFPVTSVEEMKTTAFELNSSNDAVRDHLAARLGDYGVGTGELATNAWLPAFQAAFGSTQSATQLVRFDNIALAIGEYERSMVFVDSPWQAFLNGDATALSDAQKRGAELFFTPANQGGAGCINCHSGTLFSDGSHHTVAFPQFGPGKGDNNGANSEDDFGRERETGDPDDRYRFRVPSLLNVELTAPYGHSGAYATLEEVVRHYDNPTRAADRYFDRGGWCLLDQFRTLPNCAALYPNARGNTARAADKLRQERNAGRSLVPQINLNGGDVADLVAFLTALTDPCARDRDCLSPWIANPASSGPDGQQLNAVDAALQPL